jgi:hypothetical protein
MLNGCCIVAHFMVFTQQWVYRPQYQMLIILFKITLSSVNSSKWCRSVGIVHLQTKVMELVGNDILSLMSCQNKFITFLFLSYSLCLLNEHTNFTIRLLYTINV